MTFSGNISHLSDLELLSLLCSSEEDDGLYTEFVGRFSNELIKECKRICINRHLDNHTGIQIANQAFERVRKYKTFKQDQIKCPDVHKGIFVYLIRICIRLFNDHFKKEQHGIKIPNHKTYFDNLYGGSQGDTDPEILKLKKDAALVCFQKLSEKEKKVITTDLEYKKFHRYLPDDVNEHLAEELKVSIASIRKIRQRAVAKIKKAIDELVKN